MEFNVPPTPKRIWRRGPRSQEVGEVQSLCPPLYRERTGDGQRDRERVCVRDIHNLNESGKSGWLCVGWCVYEPMYAHMHISFMCVCVVGGEGWGGGVGGGGGV